MKKLILTGIIIIAALLRLYNLPNVPPGVNRDEAAIGFTARSLMETGKDEYGKTLPLSFESFGDWKLPLYIYTTIPFVKAFGESELAVRLPSALAGILSVAAIYYLTNLLFASETVALLSAAVLALMPWHIHISRVESEAIVAVLFLIVGSILFLKAIKQKSLGTLICSGVLFALTFYTYHGNHVSTSLLLLGMAAIYWKGIVRIPRFWIAVGAGAVLVIGILSVTLTADSTKISGISIFGDPTVVHNNIELPRLAHGDPNSMTAKLLHNRITYAATTVFQNYLRSYGPDFLFIKGGGNSAHNILGYGNLHPIEAIFLLLGVACLLGSISKKSSRFILWWIAIGAVAAAITKDAPHSNRMLMVVPSLAIAAALGIQSSFAAIPKRWHTTMAAVLILGYAACMTQYLDMYYVHFPRNEAKNWGYAYQKLTPLLFSPENKDKTVIMTRPETSPYIYLLFYSGYSPADYQREAKRYPTSRDGFTDVAGFGRFAFRAVDTGLDFERHNTLLVMTPDDVPSQRVRQIIATITLPDGTPEFLVLDTDR